MITEKEVIEKLVSVSERSIEASGRLKGQVELLARDISDAGKDSERITSELKTLASQVKELEGFLKDSLTQTLSSMESIRGTVGKVEGSVGKIEIVVDSVSGTVGKMENRDEWSRKWIAIIVLATTTIGSAVVWLMKHLFTIATAAGK